VWSPNEGIKEARCPAADSVARWRWPLGGDDEAFGWFDPLAVVGEVGLGADRPDDGVGRGFGVGALFDSAAHVGSAEFEEAEGVRVAVEGVFGNFVIDGENSLSRGLVQKQPVRSIARAFCLRFYW
jgi:hypothetical protein